jgi:hypothetical protein
MAIGTGKQRHGRLEKSGLGRFRKCGKSQSRETLENSSSEHGFAGMEGQFRRNHFVLDEFFSVLGHEEICKEKAIGEQRC